MDAGLGRTVWVATSATNLEKVLTLLKFLEE
ncbi:hypothetical protein MY3296_001782 [Beauveria thailandica]